MLNSSFIDPPSTALPSAAAFSNIETDRDRTFYFASADIKNCFYSLAVPDDLSDMFTLQGIQAGLVGISSINGHYVPPHTL
eukprot:1058203-Karenia_brevis.AAC.1